MIFRRAKRASALCIALALLLSAVLLTGCGNGAQLKTGQKLMKQYLSGLGRGAALQDSHVDVLRPAADRLVASDYVKGTFRVGGERYDFAVNTETGEIFTSEKRDAFLDCCIRSVAAQLGLDRGAYTAVGLMDLYRPAWQEERGDWPGERAYLGEVIPVGVTDMDAFVAEAIADENDRILIYIACRSGELREGRWSVDELADWNAVEVQLFGFADDEPLPSSETFPRDYHYASDRPRMTLSPSGIDYRPGTKEGS